MRAHVSLTTEGMSAKHLEVNGQQIPGVTNVGITVSAEGIPIANITLIALDALIFDGDAEVNLTAQTEDTLRLLGWTKIDEQAEATDGETTLVESEDYPPTGSHFPDIGGRR